MSLLAALMPLWSVPAIAADDDEAKSRPVGGALAGWGAVPLASEDERADGATHLWGQLQVWTTVMDQDVDPQADPATYGDPEADPGFSIQRARLGIDGFVPMGDGFGKMQVDYALSVGVQAPYDVLSTPDTDVQLVDGFGRWALPTGLGVTSLAFGSQRVPFSREAMMSSAHLVFQERSVSAHWLAPTLAVGAIAGQSFSLGQGEDAAQILVRLGAFDGGDGSLFGDGDPGLLVSGRAELILGDAYRTWSPKQKSAIGLGGAALQDRGIAVRTTSIEGDLLARYKIVTAMAEVITSSLTPVGSGVVDPALRGDVGRLGLLGQLSVYLPVKGPSGVEIAGRYSTFDDRTGVEDQGDVGILHAGATWRNLLPRTDVGAAFVHRTETDEVANDTVRLTVQIRPEGRF